MVLEQQQTQLVIQGKAYVYCVATNLVKKARGGEDVDCCERQLMILIKLLRALECYTVGGSSNFYTVDEFLDLMAITRGYMA